MKKTGILNSDISRVVADMGHMDWLGIGDAGTPVPKTTEKIDLAVSAGLSLIHISYAYQYEHMLVC